MVKEVVALSAYMRRLRLVSVRESSGLRVARYALILLLDVLVFIFFLWLAAMRWPEALALPVLAILFGLAWLIASIAVGGLWRLRHRKTIRAANDIAVALRCLDLPRTNVPDPRTGP
jgi:hypothetical protein